MTGTNAPVECGETAFVPVGRPVIRFVSVLVVVVLVLGALWITGVVAARVTVASDQSQFDAQTKRGSAVVDIHNVGLLSARVDQLDVSADYIRLGAPAPTRPVRVAPGAHRNITVSFVVDCEAYLRDRVTAQGATDPSLSLRVHVKGAVGAGRWVGGGEIQSPDGYCVSTLPLP